MARKSRKRNRRRPTSLGHTVSSTESQSAREDQDPVECVADSHNRDSATKEPSNPEEVSPSEAFKEAQESSTPPGCEDVLTNVHIAEPTESASMGEAASPMEAMPEMEVMPGYATKLLEEVQELKSLIQGSTIQASSPADPAFNAESACDPTSTIDRNPEDVERIDRLSAAIDELKLRNETLEEQNHELTEQFDQATAGASGEATTANITGGDTHDLLTWDQRKELIYRQMEDDSFDAESFLSTLKSTDHSLAHSEAGECDDPVAAVTHVFQQIDLLREEVTRRDNELAELRAILEQREHAGQGVAVGAAAIAQMLDGDDLINEERERLQQMQVDWEEKFRQAEIEASLERAKLSRERRELQRRNAELEESLEHARRENAVAASGDGRKRRWLAELGL